MAHLIAQLLEARRHGPRTFARDRVTVGEGHTDRMLIIDDFNVA
jgi:hypothetical protein